MIGVPVRNRSGKKIAEALVDDEDAWVLDYSWHPDGGGYAGCVDGLMHRLILDAPLGVRVDHCNRDGFDNRRANLRLSDASTNAFNAVAHRDSTSQYKGVHFDRATGRWRAQIRAGDTRRSLGRFTTDVEAARAYDDAARELHGSFARTNFQEN